METKGICMLLKKIRPDIDFSKENVDVQLSTSDITRIVDAVADEFSIVITNTCMLSTNMTSTDSVVRNIQLEIDRNRHTPYYSFDLDMFVQQVNSVKAQIPLPLTYSIKANPFLLEKLPDNIAHVEVCSPGELEICKELEIPPEKIIYSGVMKEHTDICEAIEYGVDILTCESIRHAMLIEAEVTPVRVLLRLSSGNQFGMSLDDLKMIIQKREEMFPHLEIIGIHYFSGTQKTRKKIEKDLIQLESALIQLWEECEFRPQMVEYGPGLPIEYFSKDNSQVNTDALVSIAPVIMNFAERYPLALEMGRFLAAPCGSYYTKVMDIKQNNGVTYIILDGGIHHLNYYGQCMAMKVPEIEVLNKDTLDKIVYCLCGSLCTVADVLVREVELPELSLGDTLRFGYCGAYSVTEAPALFLSRSMPEVYVTSDCTGTCKVRNSIHTSRINRRQIQ